MASLLSLPGEILLQVVARVSSIPEEKQRTLKNASLTCRRLQPIAQEVLLEEPCVNMYLLPSLTLAYAKNNRPAQAQRVTTLKIRPREQHGCTCTFQSGQLAVAVLNGLRNLLAILPKVNTLHLGANRMQDIMPLHYMFLDEGNMFCTHHGWMTPDAPNPIASLPNSFYPELSSRLTGLELPSEWARLWNGRTRSYTPFDLE
ncbi:hypothetical protein CC86DRAFT_437496 [Ophiobolus disseminans]|uniref:F-box domain-containing protein n=1 Tax=Ophiobolus disseminans TaxID=1469910 RepID=A0A6A7A595_9PLEO|nr:hypothetical protein CC86DRAFT_437496 [Ophiobolus disseminans]